MPLVEDLVAESVFLNLIQQLDRLESWRILRDESTFLKQTSLLGHPDLNREVLNILEQSCSRNTGQRVLNAARKLISMQVQSFVTPTEPSHYGSS